MNTYIQYRYIRKILLPYLVTCFICNFSTAQDKHIDPSPTYTVHRLSFSKHVSTNFDASTVDALLKFGTTKLQECDDKVNDEQDVACKVSFERSGLLGDFGTPTDGLDIITDLTEESIVQSMPGFVKVVTAIMLDGKIITGKVPRISASSMILAAAENGSVRSTGDLGQTFVHEFGHDQGLYHRRNPDEPANPYPSVGQPFMDRAAGPYYQVNQGECAAYHNGFNVGSTGGINRKSRIVFVVDDTGSMTEEIDGVKNGINLGLTLFSLFTGNSCNYVFQLVTFKDNVTPRNPTTDLTLLRNQVSALVASGGGECPEASVEAIDYIKDSVEDNGFVFLFTDASPHANTNISGVTAALRARGIRLCVLLSGDCSSFSLASTALQSSDSSSEQNVIPYSDNHDGKGEDHAGSTGSVLAAGLPTNPTAIEAYSYMALETGGVFSFIPEVNTRLAADRTRYENKVYNILVGGVAPAVVDLQPTKGPKGSTLAISLTGTNTHFNSTTALSFADTGIVVKEVKVVSPTILNAIISIGSSVSLGFKDVKTTTKLSDEITDTTAGGKGLLEVVTAPATPTILSISPFSGSTGQILTVKVTGINTHFSSSSVLNLGSGITVLNTTAISNVELEANIKIAADAALGYRDVRVTTGSEIASEAVIGPFLVTVPVNPPNTDTTLCRLSSLSAGPDQSINLFYPDSSCAILSLIKMDSTVNGYTVKWSTGDTTASIKVCPTVTTSYTVTISKGTCTLIDTVIVQVARCPRDIIVTAPSCSDKATIKWTEPMDTFPASISAPAAIDPSNGTHTFIGAYNGHGYYRSNNDYPWPVARDIANYIGGTGVKGHLATLTSADENNFIYKYANSRHISPWIGLFNTGRPGRFRWIGGESLEYTNWALPDEPNNKGGTGGNVVEPYVQIYDDGTWNDAPNINLPFITEFEKPLIKFKKISGPKNGSAQKSGVYTVCYERTNTITDDKDTCCFSVTVKCGSTLLEQAVPAAAASAKESIASENSVGKGLRAKIRPNPSTTQFVIDIASESKEKISLHVFDALGRTIERREGIQPSQSIRIGSGFKPGIYFVQLTQATKKITMKVMKQSN